MRASSSTTFSSIVSIARNAISTPVTGLPTPVAQTAAAILVQGTAGLLASLFSGRGEQEELIDIYVYMTLGALDRLAEQRAASVTA